jgi:hypothetical protein
MTIWTQVGWWPFLTRVTPATALMVTQQNQQQVALVTMDALVTYLQESWAAPGYQTQFITPTTGFSQAVTDNSQSTWLIIQPSGTLATGTIVLPLASNCIDGQEVMVSTTQEITALTVSGNSAIAVYGAPTTLAAETSFRLRYYLNTTSWYMVT